MPRTKVTKTSKRNREDAKIEEKLREVEAEIEQAKQLQRQRTQECVRELTNKVSMLKASLSTNLLKTKVGLIFNAQLPRFADWPAYREKICPLKAAKSLDDGYVTEDSQTSKTSLGSSNSLSRPGPFSSARAARGPRRSKSASCDITASKKNTANSSNSKTSLDGSRESRSKMRTPLLRQKALSSDRSQHVALAKHMQQSPVSTFMRWPKPGELAVSTGGSPLVTNSQPSKFAHLNIPIRDGYLSMQPKKLDNLRPDIVNDIDEETLQQLRTLRDNLNKVFDLAQQK